MPCWGHSEGMAALSAGHTGLGVALEKPRGPAVLQLQGVQALVLTGAAGVGSTPRHPVSVPAAGCPFLSLNSHHVRVLVWDRVLVYWETLTKL